jgi:NAD(P)-dependent dehydrogenase (short-subunit alcohol dehydrogenase family)
MRQEHRKKILVIGGGSGMGHAFAKRMLDDGCHVVIAGRNPSRLQAAVKSLTPHGAVEGIVADATDEAQVVALFKQAGRVDHIVMTAADVSGAYTLPQDIDIDSARNAMASKILAPLLIAKHGAASLAGGGSITLTSGIAAYRPGPKGCIVAAINGALESMVYAMSLALAPTRVNAVSPGWVDTPIWESVAGSDTPALLEAMAARLPAGRIGRADEVADAIAAVMSNGFINGTVLHVDGGQRLV